MPIVNKTQHMKDCHLKDTKSVSTFPKLKSMLFFVNIYLKK